MSDPTFLQLVSGNYNWHWLDAYSLPAPRHRLETHTNTGLYRFPFNNFTHCLTPFSRCFSSFPHGTCSLSVSCQYLALDEIYHPLWAAFPNNSTRWKALTWDWSECCYGALTLSGALFQGTWAPFRPRSPLFRLQFATQSVEILTLSFSRFTRRY